MATPSSPSLTGSASPSPDSSALRMARRGSLSLMALTKVKTAAHSARSRATEKIANKKRAEFAMIEATSEKWVWIVDETEAFVHAKIVKENPDGSVEAEVGASQTRRIVKKAELGPPITRAAELKNHVSDMVRMGDVNEATILHNLRMRFMEDLIYTNIGTILVSINPFKWMDHLYTRDIMEEHLNLPPGEIPEPHVFQIAAAAFNGVRSERVNQSIIISGESGSGKTEATKKCLQFFASAAGSAASGMDDKLLQANPILEAFGNAKTLRNNNSSRFGKWMEVHFNGRMQICGSQIINYLLEKSRVVQPGDGERNYHIFYQLCVGCPSSLREKYALAGAEHYFYTKPRKDNPTTVDGIRDHEEFGDVLKAFAVLGMNKNIDGEPEHEQMFQVVAALLHLSAVTFDPIDSDSCRMNQSPTVKAELGHAARLLGIEAEALRLGMEQRLIETKTDRLRSPLSAEKALDARNSMAKALYGRMFDWLVQRVNSALADDLKSSENVIGVLDIFGFEIFKVNSFEQLCINYCNEKLQQHFNYHVFKAEERTYQAEGIDYAEVKFIDNQDVLDLVEYKPPSGSKDTTLGLLPRLDDECKVPKGSDAGFVEKITRTHNDNPRFGKRPRRGPGTELEFGVNHYAGLVVYNAGGFLEKNKDELLLNIRELLMSSTNAYIKLLFGDPSGGPMSPTPGAAGGRADKISQSAQFRNQLETLMGTLNATQPHYIRCVKPTDTKKPNVFEAPICLQQLRYAGVFEAVKIRQQGYPFRWTYEHMYKRYRPVCLLWKQFQFNGRIPPGFNWRTGVDAVVRVLTSNVPQLENMLKFGRTMVLYRADPHRILEMLRDRILENCKDLLERVYLGWVSRKRARALRIARDRMRAAIKARDLDLVNAAMAEGEKLPFRLFEMKELTALQARLHAERRCRETLAALLPIDPVDKYAEYEAALKEARALELQDDLVEQVQQKFNTVRDRIETKQNLLRGIEIGDKQLIVRSLAKADELRRDWGEIVPPSTVARAHEMLEIIAREEAILDDLREALLKGAASGAVGAVDTTSIETGSLERALLDCNSGRVKVSTAVGHNLINTAQRVLEVRRALRSGDHNAIEATVGTLTDMRSAGALAPEAEAEAKRAEAEVADRRIMRSLTESIASGAAKGRIGELNMKSADAAGLAAAISAAKQQAAKVGGLSAPASHLLACAELVLRLRQALNAGDWGSIKKAIAEAMETRLPEVCLYEVQAAKDELDNHTIVHQLTDALEKGHAVGTLCRLDLTPVDISLLGERIHHAEEMGPKTQRAHALLKLAKLVRKVRQALTSGDYTALPDLCNQAFTIPGEYVPPLSRDELLIAQYEGENVVIIKSLRDAIVTGAVRGRVGGVARGSINTSALVAALKKANSMKCRSDEAKWLHDVAEAVLEMRTGFRDSVWDKMQDQLLEVRAMDNFKPAPRTAAQLDDIPVLRERSTNPHVRLPRMSTFVSSSFANMLDAARASEGPPSAAARGRPVSLEHRAGAAVASAAAAPMEELELTFMLPEPVRDEVELIHDELFNYRVITQLTDALKQGAPAGALGELDVTRIATEQLVLAVEFAERAGPKTPPAASLLYSGKMISDLRSRLRAGDWASVEATLRLVATNNARLVRFAAADSAEAMALAATIPTSALGRIELPPFADDPAVMEQAAYTLSEVAMPEVVRAEQEAEYRRVMESMVKSLESGGPRGAVGALDLTSVTVADLATAIDASRALGARTERARHLTTLCRLMWQMRTAVLEGDWASVESLLAASGEVLGRTSPLPAGCFVPPALLQELELYRMEANNRRIVMAIAGAIAFGAPMGEIGRLDIGSIDVKKIEDALRLSLQLGPETTGAKCLVATAVHLRSMRLALMGGQWDRLGELLDYLHIAIERMKPVPFTHRLGISESYAAQPVIEDFAPQVYSNTKNGAGIMGTWPGVLDASAGYDLAVLGVSTVVAAEVNKLQLELNNRNIIVQLTAAIAKGSAGGTTGHLDLSTVETGTLEWAIDFTEKLGVVTEDARQMLQTASIVRKIRLALLAGDWGRLEAALAEAQGKVLADIGAAEIHAAQDELNNRAILSELAAALARGRPQGRTGRLYVGSIDVKPLNEAITLSTKLTPKTLEAKQMLFTAKVVARLRLCLLNEDLAEAGMTLEAVRGKMLASVAMPEVRMIQDEVDNWMVVTELSAAIATGAAAGTVGSLDLSTVDVVALEKAIDKAEELGVKTSEATSLLAAAQLVYRLRTALLRDNWSTEDPEGVEALLREAAAAPVSDLARGELELLQREVENRRMITSLSKALAAGGAKGPVGELDTSCIDTSDLDGAIAEATELGPKTEEAEKLLSAAKLIRRLRSVLVAGNWQWVGSVLLEARGIKHVFPQISLRELQLAQDELDNRAIITQIMSALRTGAISGPIGHIDVPAIDLQALDEALAYARTLGVKATEAHQMVATATVIRSLRAAVKAGNFMEAREVLDNLKGKVLAAACADEVQLARLNVDNWLVVTELNAAICTGSATGVLGEIAVEEIKVDALDVAIALAMKVGCHTAEAKRCLVTGLIIRRLRGALLDNDFTFLAQVLSEAEREVDAVIPSAVPELQAARDLLTFREVMANLKSALDSQDEAALVDALARAARMNLNEHPRQSVRDTVEAATLGLGRIQRCKAALASGIKTLDAAILIDALAMAAGLGYAHPLVDEAKRVLASVQQLTERANASLRNMDALEMQTSLRDCEGIGLSIPALADIRRALALSRADFLRRELAAVLAPGASPAAALAPLAEGPRAPTQLEQRVILCTLQLKDLFFADLPDVDDAALVAQVASPAPSASLSPPKSSGAGAAPQPPTPASFLSHPAAASAVATLRAQRNIEDNVRGAAQRTQPVPHLQGFSWALSGALPAGAVFKPMGNGGPVASVIGGALPPLHSRLRRQFELAKFPRIKPAHMFSRKYGISDAVDTGMMRWQHEPIHTSLTMLQDANSRRLAVKTFRDILAFMGDRPLARPIALATEMLEMGIVVPELRDEIFIQLCKQLNGNPSIASAERGWVLLHLALCTFPPSEELENHLELWLRDRGAVSCVWALHLTLYRGGPGMAGAPSATEIQAALDRARAPILPSLNFDLPGHDELVVDDGEPVADSAGGTPGGRTAPSPLRATADLRALAPLLAAAASPAAGNGTSAASAYAKKPTTSSPLRTEATAYASSTPAVASRPPPPPPARVPTDPKAALQSMLLGSVDDLEIESRLASIARSLAEA